jgi:hypothetical protein
MKDRKGLGLGHTTIDMGEKVARSRGEAARVGRWCGRGGPEHAAAAVL